jgi:hypothetical protein
MSQMFLKGTASAVPFVWCAGHVQQLRVVTVQKEIDDNNEMRGRIGAKSCSPKQT